MKRLPTITIALAIAFAASAVLLHAATPVGKEAMAEGLVRAALEAELRGSHDDRETLLEQAIKLAPNFAPARWQSGFVSFDGMWLKPEQVARRAASDERLEAY